MDRNRISPVAFACTVSLLLASVLAGCSTQPRAPEASPTAPSKPVQYIAVTEQPVEDGLELSAKVQPDPTRIFRIFPPASGRIVGIEVKPGDTVKRGQTLGTISSSDAASARSDFAKARIEAQRAANFADREKALLDHGAIPEKDYVDARAAADSAQAELARAKQRLQVLDLAPDATTDRVPLLSPARGVVLSVSAAPGEFSKSLDNADPIITLADLSSVWIVGDVYEKDIAKVQPGRQVSISLDAFPGRQWKGRIDSLSGALDPATRTLKVRVALPNPHDELKPEMFAAIHVAVGKHNAIVVPASAVIHEGQTTTVFIENNGKTEQQGVSIGQAVDGKVEIVSGLRAGQHIVIDGAELLSGGPAQP